MLRFVPVWAISTTSLAVKVLLIVGLFFGLYLPAAREHAIAKADFDKVSGDLMRKKDLIARTIPGLEAKMKWVKEQVDTATLRLPGTERIDDTGVEVGKAVEKSQVAVDARTNWVTTREPTKKILMLSREMTVSGGYTTIARLLKELMELQCAISVDDLSISPKISRSEKGLLVAQMKLTTYFQELAPEPEKGP
ncbi:MAG: type 4a pilus biogenesis protein PilO [Planctomycetes bacterium]|nr:type 4a pilus biogenesis protein PilO [Planctomycetota bacterium]